MLQGSFSLFFHHSSIEMLYTLNLIYLCVLFLDGVAFKHFSKKKKMEIFAQAFF